MPRKLTRSDLRDASTAVVLSECEEWAAAFRNLAPVPECGICGCALAGTDPSVTLCDPCAHQIAKRIAEWLEANRPAYAGGPV